MATSSTTTTTPADAKPNPIYFQSAPVSQDAIQQKEVLLHLYAYQHYREYPGPNGNQKVIVNAKHPKYFGTLVVNDWTIYDSLLADDPNATTVARAQDTTIVERAFSMTKIIKTDLIFFFFWSSPYLDFFPSSATDFICFNMVFVDERFTGSSFMVMGVLKGDKGEWAIVGGTGEFAYAQGVITYKKTKLATGNLIELHVSASCLSFPNPPKPVLQIPAAVTMIGPWGSKSGVVLDAPATPQRLESVTICHATYVESLAFSFIDQAGEKHTVGPWGAKYGQHKETIELAPSEFVTQVYGTMRYGENTEKNIIASLKIITNVRTYGPFGIPSTTTFNVPVHGDDSIVGFFARAGSYVEALGVYVRPSRLN